jgi:protease I
VEKILLLTENGFEDRELMYPYYRFQEAGYQVVVVGPKEKETYNGEHGLTIISNLSPADVNIDEYVGVIVPGGRGPDRMRINKGMVKLVKDAVQKGKVIAAICHGPQLLIEADVVKGKKMTCYMSVVTDLKNAGAIYEDKSVVVDGKFITSRFPADLPDFCRETLRVLGKNELEDIEVTNVNG